MSEEWTARNFPDDFDGERVSSMRAAFNDRRLRTPYLVLLLEVAGVRLHDLSRHFAASGPADTLSSWMNYSGKLRKVCAR